jgi:hypothetical protein
MSVNSNELTRLIKRDRFALIFRIAGAVFGAALIIWAFATSAWDSRWVIGLLVLVTVGGAISYHVLTSIVRCPGCDAIVCNFRVSSEDARRKEFPCRACGRCAYLTEAFYWQRDFSG